MAEKKTWARFRDGLHGIRHQAKVDCFSLTSPKQSIPEYFVKRNHLSRHNCDQYIWQSTSSTLTNGQNRGFWLSHGQSPMVNLDGQGLGKEQYLEKGVQGCLEKKYTAGPFRNTVWNMFLSKWMNTKRHPLQRGLSIIKWTKLQSVMSDSFTSHPSAYQQTKEEQPWWQ